MGRTLSQNVVFHGDSHDSDPCEPPGHNITQRLRNHLQSNGYAVAVEEIWRDSGWSVEIQLMGIVLQVAIVRTGDPGDWFAQIAPTKSPGFFASLFRSRSINNHTPEVLDVARSVHQWLLQAGYDHVLWRVDGFPKPGNATPEPTVPEGALLR